MHSRSLLQLYCMRAEPTAGVVLRLQSSEDRRVRHLLLGCCLVLLQVKERRTNLPLVQQKRHDLYELVDRSSPAS